MKKTITSILLVLMSFAVIAQCDFSQTHGVLKPHQYWKFKTVEQNQALLGDWLNGRTNLDLNLGSLDFIEATQAVWSEIGSYSVGDIQYMFDNISTEILSGDGKLYFARISSEQYNIIKPQGKSGYSTNGSGGWKIQKGLRTLTTCDYQEFPEEGMLVIMMNHNGSRYVVWMAQCWNPVLALFGKVPAVTPPVGEKECCGNTYITNNYFGGGQVIERKVVIPPYIQNLPMVSYWEPDYTYQSMSFGFYIIWDNQAQCQRRIRCGNHQGQQECNYTPENPIPPDAPGEGPNGDGNIAISDGPGQGSNKMARYGQRQDPRQAGVSNTSRTSRSNPTAMSGASSYNGGGRYSSRPSPQMSGTSNYSGGGGGVKTPTARPNNGQRPPSPTVSPSMPAYTAKASNGRR